jgi:hypothetical protein
MSFGGLTIAALTDAPVLYFRNYSSPEHLPRVGR